MTRKKFFTRFWPVLLLLIIIYFVLAFRSQWVRDEQAALTRTYHLEQKQRVSRELDRLMWALDDYFNKIYRRDQYGIPNLRTELEVVSLSRSLAPEAAGEEDFVVTQVQGNRITVEKLLTPWHYQVVVEVDRELLSTKIQGAVLYNENHPPVYSGYYSDAYQAVHDLDVGFLSEGERLFTRYTHGKMAGEMILALDMKELEKYLDLHTRRYDRAALIFFLFAVVALTAIKRKWRTPLEAFEEGIVGLEARGDLHLFDLPVSESTQVEKAMTHLRREWCETVGERNAKTARLKYLEQQRIRQESSLLAMEKKLIRSLEELAQIKNRNEQLIGHIEDLLWIIDSKGTLTYVNDAALHLLDRSPKELIGASWDELLYLTEETRASLHAGPLSNHRMRFISKKGHIEQMMTTTILLTEGGETYVQGISRPVFRSRAISDMLDKKKLELHMLGQINSSLINQWTLSELLDSVVERLEQLYSVEICTIRLLHEEDDALRLKAKSGRLKDHIIEGMLPLEGEVLQTCLRENRMIHIRRFQMGMIHAYDDKPVAFLSDPEGVFIPLENEGRIIGLLTLVVDDQLSEENLEIFKTFGLQVSLAIERTRTYEKLKEEYFNTLEVMIAAIEAKDEYTKGHSRRVARVASLLAKALHYTDEHIEMVETAGLLHDIGKIGVPDAVLTKKGKLEAEEYELMKQHPLLGEDILAPIGLPERVIDGIRYHHKRFDGTGYPEEREIDSLDPISEIIGVADAFDAMTSRRSYTKNRSITEALEELKKYAGSQFSPRVVTAMVELINQNISEIKKAMEDED